MATKEGRPRGYRKSGTYGLSKALRTGGLDALDGRTALVREARAFQRRYADDLGGEANLSAGQLALLEGVAVEWAIASHVGGVLMAKPTWMVNRRSRQLSGLARDYFGCVGKLKDACSALGLRRVPKPGPSLADLLRGGDDDEPEPAAGAITTSDGSRAVSLAAEATEAP